MSQNFFKVVIGLIDLAFDGNRFIREETAQIFATISCKNTQNTDSTLEQKLINEIKPNNSRCANVVFKISSQVVSYLDDKVEEQLLILKNFKTFLKDNRGSLSSCVELQRSN